MDYHWTTITTTCRDFTCRDDELDAYLDNSVLVRGHVYLVDFKPPPHISPPASSYEMIVVEGENNDHQYSRRDELPLLPSLPLFTLLQVAVYPTSRGLLLDLAQLLCPTQSDYDNFISHKMKYRERINMHKKSKDGDASTTYNSASTAAAVGAVGAVDPDDKLSKSWRGFYCMASSSRRKGRGRGRYSKDDSHYDEETNSASVIRVNRSSEGVDNTVGDDHEQNDDHEDGDDDHDDDDVMNGLFKRQVTDRGRRRRSIISIDRRMVGVITSGQQPHMNSNSFAIGVCSAIALNAMFRQSIRGGGGGQYKHHHHPQAQMLVLFRNDRSQWIRPALLTVI